MAANCTIHCSVSFILYVTAVIPGRFLLRHAVADRGGGGQGGHADCSHKKWLPNVAAYISNFLPPFEVSGSATGYGLLSISFSLHMV